MTPLDWIKRLDAWWIYLYLCEPGDDQQDRLNNQRAAATQALQDACAEGSRTDPELLAALGELLNDEPEE